MRASDTERERIAERLREAVAEGRLTMEEFNERLDAVYQARTLGELEPLVSDLPATPSAGATPAAAPAAGRAPQRWSERIGGEVTSRKAFAVWGGFGRQGRWTVPKVFSAFVMMGGGDLDLREANFEDREVTIRCWAIMGAVDVIVPPEVTVEVKGLGIMGSFGEYGDNDSVPDPAAPRIRFEGMGLMGGVRILRKRSKADGAHGAHGPAQPGPERRGPGHLNEGDDRRQLG
ncbi:DUF1707 domain-containing protein [Streptomyces qinzhouensis]|uniref:DUF1707 domain-containing protein n=2 Tax=Streptomyces qinzhouensis TaxID=2599401 RepID=A0A5B8IQG9_9ACTN|nr:DUF1707 domain-containing protein [Streptomyces qinzhouensis]